MVAARLAKSGYYGGSIEGVLSAPADDVVTILEYEAFVNDYENTAHEINKDGK